MADLFRVTAKTVFYPGNLTPRMAAKRRRLLYRTAAYALRVIRSRIRKGKATSAEGTAPKAKTGRLKRATSFAVDERNGRAEIGFIPFASTSADPLGGKTTPDVINAGGRVRLHLGPSEIRTPDGGRFTLAPATVEATYGPRPLIEPAQPSVQQALEKFASETPL